MACRVVGAAFDVIVDTQLGDGALTEPVDRKQRQEAG
jgi:hypothetical protein